MNIKCEVIRDLLPLYVDGVASEESARLIEEHLKECADCREYLKLLQEDIPDVGDAEFADEAASLKRIKRRMIYNRVMVVVVTLIFAVFAGIVLHSAHLTEYRGTLEENVSYELPAGYELKEDSAELDFDDKTYIRKGDNTIETINIYYDDMYPTRSDYTYGEPVLIDDSTEVYVEEYDWDHKDSELHFSLLHENEGYIISYKCQETDKGDYYFSSCSKEQKDKMVEFIKTFDYHRPDGSDKNIFQILYHNIGIYGFIILGLSILLFIGLPVSIAVLSLSGFSSKNDEDPISSRDLHESMNRERKAKGEPALPAINNVQGASSNNLARRDHSWSSVPDFFIKLFRRK